MGPLQGVRVIEIAGIGPGPFAAMMLADMGAEVVRVDRTQNVPVDHSRVPQFDVLSRGRKSIALDLKRPEAIEAVLRLAERADGLIEGFRPGVMERLGLSPEVCLGRNPRLIFGRMTGWGQEGPLARAAGHDINYIALAGALAPIGRRGEAPLPPLNLVGDFGGGGMLLAFGVVCALVERQRSGKGQVVDAAMTDGAASLMSMFYGMAAAGMWADQRGANLLDSGAHFYDTYETKDGKFIALGSIEPQFYRELLEKAEIKDAAFEAQMDRKAWPDLKKKIEAVIKTKTRDEWDKLMLGSDVCYAPVLSLAEAPKHAHNQARQTFIEIDGVVQPAPAPRFSRTVPEVQAALARTDSQSALNAWGFSAGDIEALTKAGAV